FLQCKKNFDMQLSGCMRKMMNCFRYISYYYDVLNHFILESNIYLDLQIYGESDDEKYYVTSDFEEEIMEEERKLADKKGKKTSPFIYTNQEYNNSPSNFTSEESENEESLAEQIEHLINLY